MHGSVFYAQECELKRVIQTFYGVRNSASFMAVCVMHGESVPSGPCLHVVVAMAVQDLLGSQLRVSKLIVHTVSGYSMFEAFKPVLDRLTLQH